MNRETERSNDFSNNYIDQSKGKKSGSLIDEEVKIEVVRAGDSGDVAGKDNISHNEYRVRKDFLQDQKPSIDLDNTALIDNENHNDDESKLFL